MNSIALNPKHTFTTPQIPQPIAETQSGAATLSKTIDTQANLKSGESFPMQAVVHRNSSKFTTSHALFKLALLVKNQTTSHRGGADGFVRRATRQFRKATWSEVLVYNVKTNEEIWIPRRFLGEVSTRAGGSLWIISSSSVNVRPIRGVARRVEKSSPSCGHLGDGQIRRLPSG